MTGTIIGDPVMIRMREKLTELVKRRDRLNKRIENLQSQIDRHPKLVQEYLAAKAKYEASKDPRRIRPIQVHVRSEEAFLSVIRFVIPIGIPAYKINNYADFTT